MGPSVFSNVYLLSNPCKVMAHYIYDRIGGVMVNVLATSVVDCGFDPRSGQNLLLLC